LVVDGKVFWGLDSLPMLRDFITGGEWFNTSSWAAAGVAPPGIKR
jgi:hypothetical protein